MVTACHVALAVVMGGLAGSVVSTTMWNASYVQQGEEAFTIAKVPGTCSPGEGNMSINTATTMQNHSC